MRLPCRPPAGRGRCQTPGDRRGSASEIAVAEPARHIARRAPLAVYRPVHSLHLRRVDLASEGAESLHDLGSLLSEAWAGQHDRVIGRDHASRVFEDGEVVGRDPSVCREGGDRPHLPGLHRFVHQRRIHAARPREGEAIAVAERTPLGTREELVVAREFEARGMTGQIIDRSQREPGGGVARHGHGVGVLEAERCDHFDPELLRERPLHFLEHRGAVVGKPLAAQDGRPDRAGIVDIDVELPGSQRVESHGAPERRDLPRLAPCPFLDRTPEDLGEDVLLGEAGDRLELQDGQGSRLQFQIPTELKDELRRGFEEWQEAWDSEGEGSIAEELGRVFEQLGGEGGFQLPEAWTGRDRRPRKTVHEGTLFRYRQDADIGEDLIVDGDVIVIGADAYVLGEVRGNVVVVLGDLFVEDRGEVGGAISAGGRIELDDSASVNGTMLDFGQILPGFFLGSVAEGGGLAALAYFIWLAVLGILLFVGFAIAGARLERTAAHARMHLGRDVLAGSLWLSVGLGAMVVAVLGLAITVIGIPVAVILALGFVGVLLLAYFTAATLLGERLFAMTGGSRTSAWGAAAVGLALLELPGLLRIGILSVDGLEQLAFGLQMLSLALRFGAVSLGFGAIVATRGGARSPEPGPDGVELELPQRI